MNKVTKEMKLLLGSGAALLLLAYMVLYTPLLNPIFGSAPKGSAAGNAAIVIPTAEAHGKLPQEKTADAHYLRDPFRVDYAFEKAVPATAEGKAAESAPRRTYLALQGIFSLPNKQTVAIIDDKMYNERQKVYGWTIIKIYSDRVILSKSGKMKTLKLRLGV